MNAPRAETNRRSKWRRMATWVGVLTFTAAAVFAVSLLGFGHWAQLTAACSTAAVLGVPVLVWNRRARPQPAPKAVSRPVVRAASPADSGSLVEQMLHDRRYGLLLRPEIRANLSESQLVEALETLLNDMTAVAGGAVGGNSSAVDLACDDDDPREAAWSTVAPFYLDRAAVTNEQFAQFVAAAGYESPELWHAEVWAAVSSFVDRDGQPGPRYWQQGCYPPGKENHPVVGVTWYEAAAYARWLGKRLPTDAEWQKAGSCPVMVAAGQMVDRRFPWGDAVDRSRANIWGSGPYETVPVDHYAEKTVGGIHQLVGNVWEWIADDFGQYDRGPRNRIVLSTPMQVIRGGAFDTYFDSQATCQFQSGENPMSRRQNIGFRLALSVRDLEMPPPADSD